MTIELKQLHTRATEKCMKEELKLKSSDFIKQNQKEWRERQRLVWQAKLVWSLSIIPFKILDACII